MSVSGCDRTSAFPADVIHFRLAEVSIQMSGHSKDEPNAKFTDFMRRLVAVPHSEIKAKLEAEKEAKRASKLVSRVPAFPAKQA